MLAVSALRNSKDEKQGEVESFRIGAEDLVDFSDGNLLDSIDFDDLFVGINDGDILGDLEMDPELLAEFSGSGGEEYTEANKSFSSSDKVDDYTRKDEDDKVSGGSDLGSSSSRGEREILSKRDESCAVNNPTSKKADNKGKNSHGKRKVKVDWTPELHRRFVQAVEQLGVDKAVPSRILDIMGIDCLTRHNIASHLQKYRSHRKHLLAREAEASSWTQRRQMYGGGGGKKEMVPWVAPTIGFPPMNPMHTFRPLHVWGHPSMDQSVVHMWPIHLPHPPSQPPWVPHPPHHHGPNLVTPGGAACFPQAVPAMRFGAPPVPGIPPHAMYRLDSGIGVPTPQSGPPPVFDFQPSKESIDAAIGDILSKPWQPLPLGLKPPAIDSVMVELQRQGVPKIPPTCTT